MPLTASPASYSLGAHHQDLLSPASRSAVSAGSAVSPDADRSPSPDCADQRKGKDGGASRGIIGSEEDDEPPTMAAPAPPLTCRHATAPALRPASVRARLHPPPVLPLHAGGGRRTSDKLHAAGSPVGPAHIPCRWARQRGNWPVGPTRTATRAPSCRPPVGRALDLFRFPRRPRGPTTATRGPTAGAPPPPHRIPRDPLRPRRTRPCSGPGARFPRHVSR